MNAAPTSSRQAALRVEQLGVRYGALELLLDEPAAGLGGDDMARLVELLTDLKREGIALVVIEHHMDLIMAVADRICVLDLGKQLAYGVPSEIRQDPRVLEAYLGKPDE